MTVVQSPGENFGFGERAEELAEVELQGFMETIQE